MDSVTPSLSPDFDARYRIVKELGAGASSTVYLAHQRDLDRPVVIKVLRDRGAQSGARFLREARIVSGLQHPGLTRMVDYGQDGPLQYLIFLYQPVESLKEVLGRRRSLPWAEAVPLLAQLAEALDYLHGRGVVHRDLKPDNVLLTPGGRALLTDFGISLAEGEYRLTRTGTFVGTPAYASPEQLATGTAEPRSDLFGLGLMAYEMLFGVLPLVPISLTELLRQRLNEDIAQLPPVSPALPAPFEALILSLLARKPGSRPASARAVAQALAELQAPARTAEPVRGPVAPVPGSAAPGPRPPAEFDTSHTAELPVSPRRAPRAAFAVVAALLAAVSLALVSLPARRSPAGESAGQAHGVLAPFRAATVPLVDRELLATTRRIHFRARTLRPIALRLAARPADAAPGAGKALVSRAGLWHRFDVEVEPGRSYRLDLEADGEPVGVEPRSLEVSTPDPAVFEARCAQVQEQTRAAKGPMLFGGPGGFIMGPLDREMEFFARAEEVAREPCYWTPDGQTDLLDLLESEYTDEELLARVVDIAGSAADPRSERGRRTAGALTRLLMAPPARSEAMVFNAPGPRAPRLVRALCELGDEASLAAVRAFLERPGPERERARRIAARYHVLPAGEVEPPDPLERIAELGLAPGPRSLAQRLEILERAAGSEEVAYHLLRTLSPADGQEARTRLLAALGGTPLLRRAALRTFAGWALSARAPDLTVIAAAVRKLLPAPMARSVDELVRADPTGDELLALALCDPAAARACIPPYAVAPVYWRFVALTCLGLLGDPLPGGKPWASAHALHQREVAGAYRRMQDGLPDLFRDPPRAPDGGVFLVDPTILWTQTGLSAEPGDRVEIACAGIGRSFDGERRRIALLPRRLGLAVQAGRERFEVGRLLEPGGDRPWSAVHRMSDRGPLALSSWFERFGPFDELKPPLRRELLDCAGLVIARVRILRAPGTGDAAVQTR